MSQRKSFPIDAARVRAVVFDLGGVFLEGGPSSVAAFGERIGLPRERWDAVRHELFVAGDAWGRLRRGHSRLDDCAPLLRERVAAEGAAVSQAEARDFMGSPGDRAAMPVRPEIVGARLAV